MASKTKKKQTSAPKGKSGSKPKRAAKPVKKEHGAVLTILLVLMAIHGVFATYFYNALSRAPEIQRPWIISMMIVHSLANVLAAAGIYAWKKWALYVYAGSTILALVAGLLSIGAWSTFYVVLPLAIVGWVLRDKWGNFE